MKKIKLINNKDNIEPYFRYIGLFLLYFIVQYKAVNDAWFAIDELDIMIGGKTIANGYQLYNDYISQHMPISYYISALFDMFGATTVSLQRVAFYMFFSIAWVCMYIRYKSVIDGKVLVIFPLCYTCLLSYYDMGTAILSEHIAAIGFEILFFEFLQFYDTRMLEYKNFIAISIAVILSFGTIFVAIFAIFVIAVGVMILEIRDILKQPVNVVIIKGLLKKYGLLVLFVSAPWLVLLSYYLITGNLYKFYFSAYKMNTTNYANYIGGYGSAPLATLIGIPDNMNRAISGTVTALFTGADFRTVIYFVVFIIVAIFLILTCKRKGIFYTAEMLLFLYALSTRGCFSYHGTHWVGVVSIMISYVIVEGLLCSNDFGLGVKIFLVCSCFLIANSYLSSFSSLVSRTLQEGEDVNANILSEITDEGEGIWVSSILDNSVLMAADRPCIGNAGGAPWMWEAHGSDVLNKYKKQLPRVAIFDPHHELWGHALVDYGPELIELINGNYTCYANNASGSGIYIRNDYYKQAVQLLAQIKE